MCMADGYIWSCHSVTMNLTKEKKFQNSKNIYSHWHNLPVHTCDTVVWVHGMPQCAKIDYHTHTHTTRFGKPMGFPVPMLNLTNLWPTSPRQNIVKRN